MINVKNLLIRSISGVVIVALLLGAVLCSDVTCFLILFLVALGCQVELLRTEQKAMPELSVKIGIIYAASSYIVSALLLVTAGKVPAITAATLLLTLFPFVRGGIQMYRIGKQPLQPVACETFALFYTAFPIMCLLQLSVTITEFSYRTLIALLFIFVWINDVGAYLIGTLCGRHKLFERLSPKKSWEGFFGGVIFATIAGAFAGYFWLHQTPALWAAIAFAVAIAGVFGDLFESMLKRAAGIKDSGRIIPGHGGLLDRFDAFLFAAPIYAALLLLTRYF